MKKSIELRQERTALLDEMDQIVKTAERENREFTVAEKATFDTRTATVQGLETKISSVEWDERQQALDWEAGRLSARTSGGPRISRDTQVEDRKPGPDDGQEVRAFASDESIAKHLARFHPRPAGVEGVTFGSFVRALAIGARNQAEKRALSEASIGSGLALVPSYLSPTLIDLMRARAVVIRAGATTVNLSPGYPFSFAKLVTDPTCSWHSENAADITPSDPTFERVSFDPHVLIGAVVASRELLEDAVGLDSAIESALAKVLALELDRVALFGSGTPPEPKGIYNTASVLDVEMGSGSGAAFTDYDPFLDALLKLADENAGAPTAAVMSNRTATNLAKLKTAVTLEQLPRPRELDGVPFLQTSQVPDDLAVGSPSSGDGSAVILGNFVELMLGIRHDVTIEVIRESLTLGSFQFGICAHLRADTQVSHPESFCKITSIIPVST